MKESEFPNTFKFKIINSENGKDISWASAVYNNIKFSVK